MLTLTVSVFPMIIGNSASPDALSVEIKMKPVPVSASRRCTPDLSAVGAVTD